MTEEQFKLLMSEIKILSTKIRFIEDDLEQIKTLLENIQMPDQQMQEENTGNWKVERF